jgi:hypothetical protein
VDQLSRDGCNYSTGEVEVADGIIYHKTEYRERRNHFAYFACSEPLAGFDTQREAFLGPCRGWDRPLVVERGESSQSIAHGWAPHGSHHVRIQVAPGQTREVIFLLGYWENPEDDKFDPPGSGIINKALVRPVIDRWLRSATVADGLRRLQESWASIRSVTRVSTPDADTNRIVNIWNPYQCMVTFNMSRSVSLFESGISRGVGERSEQASSRRAGTKRQHLGQRPPHAGPFAACAPRPGDDCWAVDLARSRREAMRQCVLLLGHCGGEAGGGWLPNSASSFRARDATDLCGLSW